jgi:hypothetical protein
MYIHIMTGLPESSLREFMDVQIYPWLQVVLWHEAINSEEVNGMNVHLAGFNLCLC